MKALPISYFNLALFASLLFSACDKSEGDEQEEHETEEHHEEQHTLVVTTPISEDVISTQQYVCQIHSRRHVEVRALERGYLEAIHSQEGQTVKKGDVMFRIIPVVYQASLDTAVAEAELAQIKYNNTKVLTEKSVVSNQELALAKAELAKAQAQVKLTQAKLNFTALRAPFDGIIDRQRAQQGSLVDAGDILSTISDNQVMWVYFNVPEARYLEYKARLDKETDELAIELRLANGEIFPQPGKIGAIEADFDNETGNIAFRADFPNPDSLLRHGQTGTILIHRKVPGAIVIPQRATYEILAKKYVYVIEPDDKQAAQHGGKKGADEGHKSASKHHEKQGGDQAEQHGIVRQREIIIQEEMDDIYVIKEGLSVNDKIVFEGIRQVRDGDRVEYELRPPQQILKHLKFHAE